MNNCIQEDAVNSIQEDKAAMDERDGASESLDLKAWLSSTPDAIIVLNSHFQICGCNEAASTFLEKSPREMVGLTCPEVLRCRTLNGTGLCGTVGCPLTRVLEKKEALPNEELLVGTTPAPTRNVSTSITSTSNGSERAAVFSIRDMSTLKEADRISPHFVSMISHELRAPLYSIHGFIDLLMQGQVGELTSEQRTYLGYAQEGVNQLFTLVEDILFMARSDSGQFEVKQEKIRFRTLVRQVFTSLQPQALKADVTLSSDISSSLLPLYVDPQRIKQVLSNLVTNAIKFTPPGGKIVVKAYPYDENFAMISVIDTGYGILPEDQQHIFERFYQSNHPQQSKVGGYGLGLSIAKVIVEQHGGFIDFETVVNEGTNFFFTAPLYTTHK